VVRDYSVTLCNTKLITITDASLSELSEDVWLEIMSFLSPPEPARVTITVLYKFVVTQF
jgi:hypothetical protein